MPPTGPFGGCFEFSPSNAMFLSLSLEICKLSSYSQTGSPVAAGSVPLSYIGPVGGVSATHGDRSGVVFGFSPSNAMFLSLSLEICKLSSYSQTGSPAADRGTVPTSYIGPIGGVGATHGAVRGLFSGFHPLTPCF